MTKAGMMRTLLAVLVIFSVALSGCSRLRDSPVNPGNWFGKSKPGPAVDSQAEVNPLIPTNTSVLRRDKRDIYRGTSIEQITALSIERLPTGAIIQVTGVSRRQGAYGVRLTSDTDGDPVDGVLTFTLEAIQPQNQPQGTPVSRTIHAARFVSNAVLEQSKVVRILGASNSMTSKR